MEAPWEPCKSPIQKWMTSDINTRPRLALLFVHNGPKRDGASPYPAVMGREQKKLKGAHLSLLRQRQNMKRNDSTDQGKTKHT